MTQTKVFGVTILTIPYIIEDYVARVCWIIFCLNSCAKIIQISILMCGLYSRNGTYASMAFIFGVEHKNPSTGCGITAF